MIYYLLVKLIYVLFMCCKKKKMKIVHIFLHFTGSKGCGKQKSRSFLTRPALLAARRWSREWEKGDALSFSPLSSLPPSISDLTCSSSGSRGTGLTGFGCLRNWTVFIVQVFISVETKHLIPPLSLQAGHRLILHQATLTLDPDQY